MVNYEFYISPLEYEVAEQNGICKSTLEQRIRDRAWDKQKAITTPPRPQRSLKEWRDLAEANGIRYPTLQKRMHSMGWDPERAATEPLVDRKKLMQEVARGRRIYPIELIEKAESNGIPYATFRQRIYNGWTMEDATTIPVMTRQEITRIVKNKYGLATREKRKPYERT